MTARYHPVIIGRYLGDYTNRFTCWSIADHEQANRTIGEKFDTLEQAQTRANELNKSVTHTASQDVD
jgi:hypothetical protein